MNDAIRRAVDALGPGPLREEGLVRHVHPLFSRVRARREIYLANHSLGRPLDQTARDVQEALDLWYERMDGAWEPWLAEIDRFRSSVARLIGFSRPDAVVPKPGAGQGVRAVLNALPRPVPHILATRGEFDSVDFILRAYQSRHRARVTWVDPDARGLYTLDAMERALDRADAPVDLVVLSLVFYATGQVFEGLDALISTSHAREPWCLSTPITPRGWSRCTWSRWEPTL